MSFRRNIKYFLVHTHGFTNKEAIRAIVAGKIVVNGEVITENIEFGEDQEIFFEGNLLKEKRTYTYIAFYKPRGIVTTHDKDIEDNLTTAFDFKTHLAFAGRLDKESEGLLLLTNDGKYIQSLSSPSREKEKEYKVTVNKPIVDSFIQEMSQGVNIVIGRTKPCFIEQTGEREFSIILTEGKNRQIRRMCKVFGYLVERLIRVRIDNIELGDMKPGEYREFTL